MSAITARPWPALLGDGSAPELLEMERAIRGKVHGAASDFRWIASSPGLDPQALRLERELLLGSEDLPAKATCWRASESGHFAVSCYPSRARDASGRSGFLEKQLLAWRPVNPVPAALGALLLLPRVATFDDRDWWERADDPGWSQPGYSLRLAAEDPIPVEDLDAVIERGRAALRKAVQSRDALERLYSTLLAGRLCIAFLSGQEEPLPPEALAVLLLPLPRKVADRLSIAGWDVSSRIDPEVFPWDVLVCRRIPAVFRTEPDSEITEEGRRAARDLLGEADFGGPGPEPDPRQDFDEAPSFTGVRMENDSARRTAAAPARSPAAIERLRSFAEADGERWLEPDELAGGAPLRLMEDQAEALARLVRRVETEIPGLNDPPGKPEQLKAKADLLRAAAVALAPAAVERVGLPESRRVPALLFCPRLAASDWDRFGDLLGGSLEEAIRQSLACEPNFYRKEIGDWLVRWRPRGKAGQSRGF